MLGQMPMLGAAFLGVLLLLAVPVVPIQWGKIIGWPEKVLTRLGQVGLLHGEEVQFFNLMLLLERLEQQSEAELGHTQQGHYGMPMREDPQAIGELGMKIGMPWRYHHTWKEENAVGEDKTE